MTSKKIFIIAIILLALVGATLLVYNLFFKESLTSEQPEASGSLPPGRDNGISSSLPGGTTSQPGQSVSPADLKFKPISQEKVYGATIGEDGKTVKYFSRAIGNIFESDFNGASLKKISSVTLSGLIKAIWSPDKEKIIGIFSENNKTSKYTYDYSNGQSSVLNTDIGWIAWSPDSKKIAYHYVPGDSDEGNISVANPDGSNWKNIFKTRLADLIVEWPVKEKISIRTPASGLAQSLVFAINSESGDFAKILSDLYGLSIKWSPKADKILYSSTNSRGKNPALFLSDEKGAAVKDLKLSGLADKCVWSKDNRTIFCALPQEISANAVWPDDYYKGLIILKDDIYKINLETGEKIKITGSSPQFGFDAQDLFLAPKEDYLFFVNRGDGLLYSLKI
ncbi:hypothetical protein KJ853_03195 [Patescibacteria group bacterium]|nr:hypothetical protein [Patescibacteria group bacterium]